MLIARRHTAVADSHASRPDRARRRSPAALVAARAGPIGRLARQVAGPVWARAAQLGSGSARTRLEVLLGLRAGGAVVRVHTRGRTVNDRRRCEQKITSFGPLDRQCLRWRSIASV